ncbi:MAG: hypothetical protein AAF620_07200 [Bacteroidota bacterium]
MAHDYSLRIENLKGRRYDEALKESILSDAFLSTDYPKSVKYALESMVEIDPSYAYKVYAISRKIHEKISKALKKRGYHLDYRYQGELKTYSNILLYGDVEIMVIKKEVSDKPHLEVQRLAMELLDILRGDPAFKSIDYGDKTRIRITALKPTCEIDILPSVWINSAEFKHTKNEIYRGIAEFDFKKKKVKKYLPFLNIARINARDQHTNGAFKRLSRLLKTLRADSEERIDLKDSEINAMIYALSENMLKIDHKNILSVLPKVGSLLNKIDTDSTYFQHVLSPTGKDRVFSGHPEKQAEVGKLKVALTQLIEDLKSDLGNKKQSLESSLVYSQSTN